MIHALYMPTKGDKPTAVTDTDEVVALWKKREGLLWIDLDDPTEEETDLLASAFALHPLAIQACREVTSQPLVHNYDEYLFLVIHAVNFEASNSAVATLELDVFWGPHFVLTFHRDPIRGVQEVRKQCGTAGSALMARGSDFLLYAMVDRIIDNFTPTLERMEDLIGECEKQMFRQPSNAILQRLMDLRRSAAYLLRVATAQRDVVGRIARGEFPQVAKQAVAYWRNAFDHLVRMAQAVDTQRDLIASARDAYLSVVSNRMNEVMKVLTVIATIFIPITFIAGLYGMNFDTKASPWNMPELEWVWGYPACLALMAAVAGAMLLYFKRKRWF